MSNTYQVTPITALSSLIAIIAIFAWLYGFFKVYKNYKENQKKQSLYFSLGLLFGGLAIVSLAIELITLQVFDNNTIAGNDYSGKNIINGLNAGTFALGFAFLAIILSSISIFMFDTFSISFFENKNKLLLIPLILLLLYIGIYIFTPVKEVLNRAGTDYNPNHIGNIGPLTIELFLVVLFFVPLFFPSFVFLISALQTRGSKYNFRRLLALFVLQVMIGIGYTIEIVGGPDYNSVIGRLFILFYPYLTWNVLQSSSFVKKLFGGTS